MTWTTRSDMVAALYDQLEAFRVANPTLLHHVYRSRPKAFSDRPLAYVGPRPEALQHSAGIHRRTITVQAVIVYAMRDYADEVADVQDDLVDAFLEYSSDRPHQVSGASLLEPRSTEDVELELDGVFYPATIVNYVHVDQKGAQSGS